MHVRLTLKIIFLILIFPVFSFHTDAQIQRKRLPQNVNIPTYSQVYPSITADGRYMILMSNYTNNGDYELKFTKKDERGAWENPEIIENIYKPRLDHFGSFCLSHDGSMLLFSSARAKGIGGYDLWYSEKRGRYWSQPKNFGKPVNSTGHEGNPSLSPDGKTLYFMRCEQMDENNEAHCSIYFSTRKSPTKWSDPRPLPAPVNMGNELNPRIMIDNKTLVFASDRPGGKGKLDLYMSKKEKDGWSRPVPLTYINTPKNDEFISLTAKGDIAFYTDAYKDKFNIFIARVPEKFRPDPVILMTGKVIYDDTSAPAGGSLIKVFDLTEGQLFTSGTASESAGGFFQALPRGATYDFSVFPRESGYDYHVEVMHLDSLKHSEWLKPVIALHPLQPGLIIPLPSVRFEGNSDTIRIAQDIPIRRLAAFMKRNPGLRVEINVFTDSLSVEPLVADTLSASDSTTILQDSSMMASSVPEDSLAVADSTIFPDSLQDTIAVEAAPAPDPAIKCREEAMAIRTALQQLGIIPDRMEVKGTGNPNNEFEDDNGKYPRILIKIIE